MKNYSAKTVDEYIQSAPKEAQPKLKEIRKLIKSTVPEAEEKISWGIPFYKHHGLLGGYAVYKKHISFGLGGPRLESKDREDLEKKGYKTGKKVIQVKFDQELPASVIKKLLMRQASENEKK